MSCGVDAKVDIINPFADATYILGNPPVAGPFGHCVTEIDALESAGFAPSYSLQMGLFAS